MKVVINKCYGGFSLSRAAIKRMAELQGRACFFFARRQEGWVRMAETDDDLFWTAFDIPDPEILESEKHWVEMSEDERRAHNESRNKHVLPTQPDSRTDPLLIRVVEEMGEAASGSGAKLVVVEIPDGVAWEIDEYDGLERVAEKHRTWG